MSWYGPRTMIGQHRRLRRAILILCEYVRREIVRLLEWLS